MANDRVKRYFLFDDDKLKLDLTFTDKQMRDFRAMWKSGISAKNIAKKMNRKNLEIGLLIIDNAERGLIEPRDSGAEGL